MLTTATESLGRQGQPEMPFLCNLSTAAAPQHWHKSMLARELDTPAAEGQVSPTSLYSRSGAWEGFSAQDWSVMARFTLQASMCFTPHGFLSLSHPYGCTCMLLVDSDAVPILRCTQHPASHSSHARESNDMLDLPPMLFPLASSMSTPLVTTLSRQICSAGWL